MRPFPTLVTEHHEQIWIQIAGTNLKVDIAAAVPDLARLKLSAADS